jgi:pilus assembly protein TadC
MAKTIEQKLGVQKKKKDVSIEDLIKWILLAFTVLGFIFALQFSFNNYNSPRTINVALVLPFVFFLTPYLILSLYELQKIQAKMQVVPRFLRDIVDNMDSGMDLFTAIHSTTSNEYNVLNIEIKKLSNRLHWGIDFDKAMLKFAEDVGDDRLIRDLMLIIEARTLGGHVDKILRELSEKIQTELLRESERTSNLASNTFTGYISFCIFVFLKTYRSRKN